MPGVTGPAPKHRSERRNTNQKARGEWVDIYVRRLDVSKWQPLPDTGGWLDDDRRRWDIWRHDPVSDYWSNSDVEYAHETLKLYDDFQRNAPEIRRRQTELALTPAGKRQHRFRIVFAPNRDTSLDTPEQRGIPNLADHRRQQLERGA